MSTKELVLEVSGWIGLVFIILTVVGIVGAITVAMFFYWEFGFFLMLYGFILVSIGVVLALSRYRMWLFKMESLPPYRHIGCPYCGMKNFKNATFCIGCGKTLSEQLIGKSSQ